MLTRVPVGTIFGSWTVVSDEESGSLRRLLARCKCGRMGHPRVNKLRGGKTQCCQQCRRHGPRVMEESICPDGKQRRRMLILIRGIMRRCANPKAKHYDRYGGRGIKVHEAWLRDRREFLRYLMGLPGWNDRSLEIDRKNNDGNYEPGNLRFVTRLVNQRNKSNTNKEGRFGATYLKRTGRWQSQVTVAGKNKYLGCYDTEAEACAVAEQYQQASKAR